LIISNNYGRELLSHEYVNVTVLPAVMVAVVGFMIKLVLDMLVWADVLMKLVAVGCTVVVSKVSDVNVVIFGVMLITSSVVISTMLNSVVVVVKTPVTTVLDIIVLVLPVVIVSTVMILEDVTVAVVVVVVVVVVDVRAETVRVLEVEMVVLVVVVDISPPVMTKLVLVKNLVKTDRTVDVLVLVNPKIKVFTSVIVSLRVEVDIKEVVVVTRVVVNKVLVVVKVTGIWVTIVNVRKVVTVTCGIG
jgi:hypothetical protein